MVFGEAKPPKARSSRSECIERHRATMRRWRDVQLTLMLRTQHKVGPGFDSESHSHSLSPRYARLCLLVLWATPLKKTTFSCFFSLTRGGAPRSDENQTFFIYCFPFLEQLHPEGILPCEEQLVAIDSKRNAKM